MVSSWIVNACEKDLADSVVYLPSAHAVWNDLLERFSRKNAPRIFQLKKLIPNLHQDQLSLSSYYTKLKHLWDELASYSTFVCDTSSNFNKYQEQERLMQFLAGLNESYAIVRSHILLMDPLPSVSRAYSLLLQEETQRGLYISPQTNENTAFSTRLNVQPIVERNGQHAPIRYPPTDFCVYCKKHGHSKDQCYKLHGFPKSHPRYNSTPRGKQPSFGTNKRATVPTAHNYTLSANTSAAPGAYSNATALQFTPEQHQQLLNMLQAGTSSSIANLAGNSLCSSLSLSYNSWIIDSGATDHIVCSPSLLSSVSPATSASVKLPNGNLAPVLHVGTVILSNDLVLNQVLCVPSFSYNLLSVKKLTHDSNCFVTFFPDHCLFQDRSTKMMIGAGKETCGLYIDQTQPTV
ncbi:uncharacterized protein LOC143891076 [Tasmannia lanceolata]|uniref:uncharacterized protein LOC143891076 n=1 Tax=Tasmannia lanceolata TaxID=3420 RepID=UPI00406419F3